MNVDLRNRAPTVERLPDSRQRVTRVADVLNWIPKTPEDILAQVWLAWGTADNEYSDCRLIKQDVRGQGETFPDATKRPPVLIRVYEQMSATAETQVGNPGIEFDQYGNKIVTIESIQLSTGTAVFGVVGTTTAPAPNQDAILKDEARTNDGTLQRIKRVYTTGGLMSQSDEIHNNGALYIRTLTYLNQVPPTPSGYININQKTEYVRGLPLYTYTFAKGLGEISRSVDYSMSVDQGVTGVTKTTIRYLVAPGGTIQPTSLAGSVLVAQSYTDEDGYRVWTTTWAKGTGTVSSSTQIKEGGKLIIYNATSLNSVPNTPSPTIGGEVTLISSGSRVQDGYTVYEASWAEGIGQVSQSDDIRNNGALLVRTIRYLTPLSVSSNPIPTPSDYTLTSESYAEQDGYRLWTAAYAKGDGQISQDDDTKNNGALLIRTIRYLSDPSVAANPISTPAGYTLTSVSYAEQDGYRMWSAAYAQGTGQISQDDDTKNNGALLIRTIRYLSTPSVAANPITTPTGYTNFSVTFAQQDGYKLWTASYAKGVGQVISTDDEIKNNGQLYLRTIRYISTPSVSSNPITTPTNYTNVSYQYADQDGYRIWTASYAKGSGEISRDIDYNSSSDQGTTGITRTTIRYLTGPSDTILPTSLSGSVLIGKNLQEQDGYRIWTTVWATGTGTISEETRYEEGTLVIKTSTTLVAAGGSIPVEPSNLISRSVRNESGYQVVVDNFIYSGSGQTSLTQTTRADASTEVNVTNIGASAATPADPFTGGYLTGVRNQKQAGGYYTNQATYIYLPPTLNVKKQVSFQMPGYAYFSGNQLRQIPPTSQTLLANEEISYDSDQLTEAPFSVFSWAGYFANYTRKEDGATFQIVQGLGGYVGSAALAGNDGYFNGVMCDVYAATITDANPLTRPTGLTTIAVDNDIYLKTISGTVIYRRSKTTYTFP